MRCVSKEECEERLEKMIEEVRGRIKEEKRRMKEEETAK